MVDPALAFLQEADQAARKGSPVGAWPARLPFLGGGSPGTGLALLTTARESPATCRARRGPIVTDILGPALAHQFAERGSDPSLHASTTDVFHKGDTLGTLSRGCHTPWFLVVHGQGDTPWLPLA